MVGNPVNSRARPPAQWPAAPRSTKPCSRPASIPTPAEKDVWGHLPAELRYEIENQNHEEPLSAKKELIDRYYLSVGKGKLVREE